MYIGYLVAELEDTECLFGVQWLSNEFPVLKEIHAAVHCQLMSTALHDTQTMKTEATTCLRYIGTQQHGVTNRGMFAT